MPPTICGSRRLPGSRRSTRAFIGHWRARRYVQWSTVNDQTADWLRQMHPHRIRYEIFSDKNPVLRQLGGLTEWVRSNRQPVGTENPFLALQETLSRQIIQALDFYRDARDWLTETLFMTIYGSPILQALVGLRSDNATVHQRIGREVTREAAAQKMAAEIEARVERGGLLEAVVRALLYIVVGHPTLEADECAFALLRQIRAEHPESRRLTLSQFKELVKEQYLMLRIDQERAIAASRNSCPPTVQNETRRWARYSPRCLGRRRDCRRNQGAVDRIKAIFNRGTAPGGEQWEAAPIGIRTAARSLARSQ